MNEEFYGLMPGGFGELRYKKNVVNKVPQQHKDKFIDNFTNQALHALIQSNILNPSGEQLSPEDTYQKARQDAQKLVSQTSVQTFKINFQIGNKEYMDELQKIETDLNFNGWDDAVFVNLIKTNYQNGIKSGIYPI